MHKFFTCKRGNYRKNEHSQPVLHFCMSLLYFVSQIAYEYGGRYCT